jgi:hypothetical protein
VTTSWLIAYVGHECQLLGDSTLHLPDLAVGGAWWIRHGQ